MLPPRSSARTACSGGAPTRARPRATRTQPRPRPGAAVDAVEPTRDEGVQPPRARRARVARARQTAPRGA
eukprot:CAMPEP_0180138484 /NCGR_PEP_ID=MMETSP0986-20121125/12925_1 /TAXON_ID=697907 /ORGANISM="non described non described, Strain CCMP2293" /LENGTH=69 /DNA_ID=CAMNT_0022080325 /DNA_START=116 /DNA_END=325 /DNA_ORIENTATION=-